jgi:GAF domain-containing protein
VEFVPETSEALAEFMEPDESDLAEILRSLSRTATRIVPECVGLSLCLVREGLTFTLVASNESVAQVDAAQYTDGGPCIWDDPDRRASPEEVSVDDLLDEGRWSLYARASAAAGIASSLSLTLEREGEVVGGVNLYASTPGAFTGHHAELTRALGAGATTAVRDADLSFATRQAAARAPEILRERNDLDIAYGILAARYHETVEEAQSRLADAAARAGLSETSVARMVIQLHRS